MKNILLIILSLTVVWLVVSCEKEDNPEPDGIYTKTIQRNFSDEYEKSLIEKAEAWYPSREEVLAAAGMNMEIPDAFFWFYQEFDGVYIPFAITADAVKYYSDLIDQFSGNNNDNFFTEAELNYIATVEFHEKYLSPEVNSLGEQMNPQDYESVYVVKMELSWYQYCGSLCAMWIEKERIVVFGEAGELLDVFMDGPIPVPVS